MTNEKWQMDLKGDIEAAIGLNVDCGGAEGVYRARDAVLAAVLPHFEAAYKRGLIAGKSKAGYRTRRSPTGSPIQGSGYSARQLLGGEEEGA